MFSTPVLTTAGGASRTVPIFPLQVCTGVYWHLASYQLKTWQALASTVQLIIVAYLPFFG
ncbi:hypothetical protein BR93DRAFT_641436 [Coniochaeta sp. PMI_546]|nr:hypothetical protein BR93DRAFT_641436 [Coniochaeta sp. PMI_546]